MAHADAGGSRSTVWIVNPYGTLPSETWATYRSTMLAECLAAHGFAVTQFMSNFEHRSKRFRAPGHRVHHIRPGYSIELVPAPAYEQHISMKRIRYERAFGRNLVRLVNGRPRPDFIVLAEPAIFYYDVLLRPLLKDRRTSLVLDVIDLWPELFELFVPPAARGLFRAALAPLYWWRRRLYRHARAVVAVAQDYADAARRFVRGPDVEVEVVYWGFVADPIENAAAGVAVQELIARKTPGDVWAIYAGTLGENYDIPAIVDVAKRLASGEGAPKVQVIVCGDGPLADLCRRSAGDGVIFLGRLGAADLRALYGHCDIALSTYKGESTVAMPIKFFDYLRFGLPTVNSLGRDAGRFVADEKVGINYDPATPGALYAAIDRLARDESLRKEMAANARRLSAEFAAERQYPRFVRLLERLSRAS